MGDRMNRRAFLGMTAAGAAGVIVGDLLGKAQKCDSYLFEKTTRDCNRKQQRRKSFHFMVLIKPVL